MFRSESAVQPRIWLLLAVIIIFAAVIRVANLEYAPVGGHGDVAWKGINALDWVDRGVFPYYVWELYAPEPFNVIAAALAMPFTGVSYLAGRTVTVIFGLLLVAFLFPAVWWLLYDQPRERREWAGLLASAAAALSMHAMYISRLGMRAAIFPAQCALLTWWVAWAWHKGGWWRWALAAVALAWMQYTYIPGRLFPVVLILWFAHGWLVQRDQARKRWPGWLVLAAVAIVLSLPNIITFIATPEAFTARADNGTAATGGWIWLYDMSAEGGLFAVLIKKIGLELLAFGIHWQGPYSVMGNPMLTPLFYIGFLIAAVLIFLQPRRIALWWPALALPVMFFTDLISGSVVEIHAVRQSGVLAFTYMLAGVGSGEALAYIQSRWQQVSNRRWVYGLLIAAAFVPTVIGMVKYLGEFIPAQYAAPDTGWVTEQIDVDLSRRIIAEPERSYLIPYDEYNRANIAFLTAQEYRYRHSALDASGRLTIPNPPEEITIVTTSDPYRIRHDGRESVWDNRLWVLLHDGQAFYLPPLLPEQVATVEEVITNTPPEALIDRSGTEIAQFYAVPVPEGLFQERPALTHAIAAATFALPGAEPEVRLAGYDLPSVDLAPGELVYVTLYWQPLREHLSEDYEIFVQILNEDGEVVGGTHDFSNGGTYRSRIWLQDETTITYHWLRLPDELPAGAYTLVAGLYRVLQNEPLVTSGDSTSDGAARLRDLRVLPEISPASGTPLSDFLRFADLLRVGTFDAEINGQALEFGRVWNTEPGDTLTVSLGWDVLARPSVDYSLFLHLTADDDAPPLAQADQPLGSTQGLPSGVWYPGEQWQDMITLTLPDDLPPGDYTLWAGVYYYADNTRLTPILNDAHQPDGRIKLATIVNQPR